MVLFIWTELLFLLTGLLLLCFVCIYHSVVYVFICVDVVVIVQVFYFLH